MADESPAEALRRELSEEYYALVRIVSEFDGRLVTVKGWSVTLSLAGLGLGFQQGHFALFGLAAASALGFWSIEAVMKRHQLRYYPRMRDIEVAAHELQQLRPAGGSSRIPIDGGQGSSPRIDWYWRFTGRGPDERTAPPVRRSPEDVRRLLTRAPWLLHVLLPHAVAFVLGLVLFLLAVADAPGFAQLEP